MDEAKKLSNSNDKWQIKLLPFMTRFIIVLSSFFFLASLVQLFYLHNAIQNKPQFNFQETISGLSFNKTASNNEILEAARLKALVALEASSIENQFHQAKVLLMARLWTSYIGFVTGMILAIVGAVFILGKLSETSSELIARISGNDFSLKSASPGLILAVLGSCLMITTLVVNHKIETRQTAIYLHDFERNTQNNSEKRPPLPAPPKYDSIDSKIKVKYAAFDFSVQQLNAQSEELKKFIAKQKQMEQNQDGIGRVTQGLTGPKPVLRKPTVTSKVSDINQ
jgi:hypothetical protein